MTKPDLYTFFSGDSSKEEKEYLRQWLEEDSTHMEIFLKERKLYNMTALHSSPASLLQGERRSSKLFIARNILTSSSKIAAGFLLAFVCYYLFDKAKATGVQEEPTAYQTITLPFGQRANLDLPDGSKVWLNAGTTIKYPVSFNDNVREVIVSGEAYFEIAKKENSPFRVIAGKHTIEVLGTKFNVNAIGSQFETALFEGSVKVFNSLSPEKAIKLTPNTVICYEEGSLRVKPLTYPDQYSWREGLLCFEKKSFKQIMEVFERSYGCRIIVKNKIVGQYLYTGKFVQTDGVDYALKLLQKNIHLTYSRDKETNTIVIN
ncbi:MAG: FecR family protein [Tannerellaceae bacterium]|jgi:ferric-dicitrate binding protein FerR (iron transport regulator)|nr:FecR family protein [Tannerellaceae bacterium]